jgi:hypothetical protein
MFKTQLTLKLAAPQLLALVAQIMMDLLPLQLQARLPAIKITLQPLAVELPIQLEPLHHLLAQHQVILPVPQETMFQ